MNAFLTSILIQQVLTFCLSVFILYACSKLLFDRKSLKTNIQLSTFLTSYFWYAMIMSIIKIAYHIYLFVFWREETVIYNPKVIFFMGLFPWMSNTINGAIEAFICLERCLLTAYPVGNRFAGTKLYAFIAYLALLALTGGITTIIIPSYPEGDTTTCRYFTCLNAENPIIFSINYVRLACLTTNMIVVLGLFIIIKTQLKTNNSCVKQMNQNVLIMVISTCAVEIVPILIILFVPKVVFRSMGPFALTGTTISIAMSIGIYFKTFKKNTRTKQVSVVSLF